MVVVLDKNAIVFTRIWCGFEQATVVQGKKLLLDFATVHEGKAQLLTEGLAATDMEQTEYVPWSGAASGLFCLPELASWINIVPSPYFREGTSDVLVYRNNLHDIYLTSVFFPRSILGLFFNQVYHGTSNIPKSQKNIVHRTRSLHRRCSAAQRRDRAKVLRNLAELPAYRIQKHNY